LPYDHVQRIIENDTIVINNQYQTFTKEEVYERINDLYRISKILKERRDEKGAISLSKRKLWFKLNKNNSLPINCGIYQTNEANSLVEEFMLLANTTVAEMLYNAYPNEALLRYHEEPDPASITKNLVLIEITGKRKINTANSKEFHDSLIAIKDNSEYDYDVVLTKCNKFMKKAHYTCSNDREPEKLFHYGLNTPCCTHFTSSIRRYPDIIVHRQLEVLINKEKLFSYSHEEIDEIAKHCNNTKMNAKKAQERSNMLNLTYLLN